MSYPERIGCGNIPCSNIADRLSGVINHDRSPRTQWKNRVTLGSLGTLIIITEVSHCLPGQPQQIERLNEFMKFDLNFMNDLVTCHTDG